MQPKWIQLVCALPFLFMACTAEAPPPPSPMKPYLGTWHVDYEHSYEFVLANQDSLGIDPKTFADYLTQMSKIIELVVADSTISLRRGRHMREFEYVVLNTDERGTTVFAQLPEREYKMTLQLDDAGLLRVRSTSPRFREMFIYRRIQPGEVDSLYIGAPSTP